MEIEGIALPEPLHGRFRIRETFIVKFALQVNSAPYSGEGSETAYRFARAALLQGHEIVRIFFYFEGIYNCLGSSGPPEDEKNIVERWTSLAIEQNIDLVVCVSAATRRGIAYSIDDCNRAMSTLLAKGFRISGLGQWAEACIEADRLLVFGD